jgi:hypothetical protein
MADFDPGPPTALAQHFAAGDCCVGAVDAAPGH